MERPRVRQYKRSNSQHGATKKQFERALIVIAVLAVVCIFLLFRLALGTTSDTRLRDVLVDETRSEYAKAYEMASQLSRIGGSNTMRLLAQTRQHLYALTELNSLAASLLDGNKALIPQEPILSAIANLETCESKLLAGQTIDEPLVLLIENLNTIAQSVQALAE